MTDGRPWRCFVAVPAGDELRDRIAALVAPWRADPALASLRWTPPEAWHVTLAFLGAVEAAGVPRLAAALEAIGSRHRAVRLRLGGLGAFPTPSRARVMWLGADDTDGHLRRLADDVADAVGVERAPRYAAHLTLARARGAPVDLRGWVASAGAAGVADDVGWLEVHTIELLRSHLGGGPARYETLARIPLRAPRP